MYLTIIESSSRTKVGGEFARDGTVTWHKVKITIRHIEVVTLWQRVEEMRRTDDFRLFFLFLVGISDVLVVVVVCTQLDIFSTCRPC